MTACSSGCILDFLDHYVDQCWYIDVHGGRSPLMILGQSNIEAHCQRRHDRLACFEHPLHLIN